MRGMVSVDDWIATLPVERQEAIAKRGAELVAKVRRRMTLAELRKGRKISQATVAEALGIGQMQIRGWRSGRTHACRRWRAPWRPWADS